MNQDICHLNIKCIYEIANQFSLQCYIKGLNDEKFRELERDYERILNIEEEQYLADKALEKGSPVIWISKFQNRIAVFPIESNNQMYYLYVTSKPINGYIRSMDKINESRVRNKEYDLKSWDKAFRIIYYMIYNKSYNDLLNKIELNINRVNEEELYMKFNKFQKNDYEVLEGLYDIENFCMEYIRKCDEFAIVRLFENFSYGFTINSKSMIFSNELETAKVLAISILTIARRTAIESGLEQVAASTMFCLYVEQLENMNNGNEIDELIISACLDFIIKIKDLRHVKQYSLQVNEALNYIHKNIYNKITIQEISDYVGISSSYLMKKFKEEVGITITFYMNLTKIDEAKRLLRFSELSINEVSELLNFSTQSYFTNLFKKEVHMSPLKYKKSSILQKYREYYKK